MIVRQSILGRDTERLVGAARILLAIAALVAPYLDSRNALAPSLAILIVIYGVIGTGVLLTQSGIGRPMLAKAVHSIDLAFTTLMLLTPNGASYFLILSTFCLLSSVIQWRWEIVLLTGAYLLSVYVLAISFGGVGAERMTIRTAYLILAPIGTALASRSAAEARNRLLKLARWSSGRYSASGDAVLRVFRHAADVLEADEVTVYSHEIDQLKGIKTTYSRETDRLASEPCDAWPEDTTAPALRRQPFLVIDSDKGLCLTYAGMKRIQDPTPALAISSRAGIVASAPFTGDHCSGRLFACGIKGWRWDQIVIVEIVASHVRSRLEGRLLRDRTTRITAELERMRLSRDLHDGILQSLTATRLQLNALAKEAPGLEPRVSLIAKMLQDEQQKLREFIEESRSASSELVSITRIAQRINVVADHWGLKVAIQVECVEAEVSEALYREVYFIISEALANSARHGHATSIAARLSCNGGRLTLVLEEEDGQASPGAYGQVLPRTIAERIRDLGGSLSISQGPRGISLKVELPNHA